MHYRAAAADAADGLKELVASVDVDWSLLLLQSAGHAAVVVVVTRCG